jgi:hypothetical protein
MPSSIDCTASAARINPIIRLTTFAPYSEPPLDRPASDHAPVGQRQHEEQQGCRLDLLPDGVDVVVGERYNSQDRPPGPAMNGIASRKTAIFYEPNCA